MSERDLELVILGGSIVGSEIRWFVKECTSLFGKPLTEPDFCLFWTSIGLQYSWYLYDDHVN